jgi:hypothetical protein
MKRVTVTSARISENGDFIAPSSFLLKSDVNQVILSIIASIASGVPT